MLYGNVSTGHGSKGRIGIKYDPAHHKIVHVYRNTPAAGAGLRAGDIVLHVNDKDILGPSYTKINLSIKRGSRIFTVEIERVPKELVNEHDIQEEEPIPIDFSVQPKTC